MELSLLQIVILAIVQGVTEFLPISSDGHLAIAAALMGQDGNAEGLEVIDVTIMLHAGTLLSILIFYWQRVWSLLREDQQLIGRLLVASIPAGVVGVGLELAEADRFLANPLLAGCLLPVTGLLLLWASHYCQGTLDYRQVDYGRALLMGMGQAFAILPGISRSGSTIALGLRSGLSPRSAATFSFLMAIPVIAGACLLKMVKLAGELSPSNSTNSQNLVNLAIGAGVSCVVGIASLWILVRWLESGRFQYFAWWVIPLGIGVVVWQLFFT